MNLKQLKQKIKEEHTVNDVTDQEAKEILDKIYKHKEERHKNEINFRKKLAEILPPKKILTLEITQRSFNKKLMHKLKDESKE